LTCDLSAFPELYPAAENAESSTSRDFHRCHSNEFQQLGRVGRSTFLESPMFTGASLLMTSATASNETHLRCREKKHSEKNHYIIYIPILFPMANMFQHMVFSVISTWCTWQELHDCSTVEIPCLVKALASGVDDLSRRDDGATQKHHVDPHRVDFVVTWSLPNLESRSQLINSGTRRAKENKS
jgi:hypothetical protein